MIIQASEINISSKHEKSESRTFSTMTNAYFGNSPEPPYLSEHSELAERFAALLQQPNQAVSALGQEDDANSNSILVMTKEGFKFRSAEQHKDFQDQQLLTQIKLFRSLLQAILAPGKTLATDNSDLPQAEQMNDPLCCQYHGSEDQSIPQQPGGISIQISLQTTETVTEHESLEFSSSGTVTTADGLDFSFALEMKMEREYNYQSTTEFTQNIQFEDPLIFNYPGTAAELADQKYSFDIDADGNEEMISFFTNGALLALDKNGDGIINDGSELFGALSGNGFADLAAYDEDGNNFIDEADSIFKDLKLWTKTDNVDSLLGLSSMDIGAIYLGATDTSFDLKGADNQFNGQVKASSFYLTDAGEAGYIQQVDMVV
ncbi:MAG: hypothetical protein MJK10_11280 [Pseudomonadales bacterium]|nr:hypothetical protein [Pseudomonadales bacterium]NRA16582.1 hypothetical protein [Oceanospirillaceae bacterium]